MVIPLAARIATRKPTIIAFNDDNPATVLWIFKFVPAIVAREGRDRARAFARVAGEAPGKTPNNR